MPHSILNAAALFQAMHQRFEGNNRRTNSAIHKEAFFSCDGQVRSSVDGSEKSSCVQYVVCPWWFERFVRFAAINIVKVRQCGKWIVNVTPLYAKMVAIQKMVDQLFAIPD